MVIHVWTVSVIYVTYILTREKIVLNIQMIWTGANMVHGYFSVGDSSVQGGTGCQSSVIQKNGSMESILVLK